MHLILRWNNADQKHCVIWQWQLSVYGKCILIDQQVNSFILELAYYLATSRDVIHVQVWIVLTVKACLFTFYTLQLFNIIYFYHFLFCPVFGQHRTEYLSLLGTLYLSNWTHSHNFQIMLPKEVMKQFHIK